MRTASGARAVQIVWSSRRGARRIEHIGSAHDEAGLAALKAAAEQRITEGQQQLDLGLDFDVPPAAGGPLTIVGSRAGHLWDALSTVYDTLGLGEAAGGDEVFRALVLARIIEPPASSTACACWRRPGFPARPTPRCAAGCPTTPPRPSTPGWPLLARRTRCWDRRRWSSTTCPRCTSRPTPGTGSASPDSPRNAGWSRRSPSGCSPTPPASR